MQGLAERISRGLLLKTVQAEGIAQHPQDLPAGPGLAGRPGGGGETLRRARVIDIGPGGLGEHGERQQHLGVFAHGLALIGAERDHRVSAPKRRERQPARGAVQLRFHAQQHPGPQTGVEHGPGVQAGGRALLAAGQAVRQRPGQPAAGTVRPVREITEARPGQARDLARERAQQREARLCHGQIAQQHDRLIRVQQPLRAGSMRLADGRPVDHGPPRPGARRQGQERVQDPGQFGGERRRRRDMPGGERQVKVVIDGIDRHDRGAVQRGLAQAVIDDRLFLAQLTADQQRGPQRFKIGDVPPQPRKRRGRVLIGKIRLPEAVVDIVAAQFAHQFLQQIGFFQRGRGRGQRAEPLGAVGLDDPAEARLDGGQRGLPIDLAPLPGGLQHGRRQAIRAVDRLVAEAVPIRQPDLVDRLVGRRDHALDPVAPHVQVDIGADRIMRRDRVLLREFPGAGRITVRLGGQGADRTQVDHIARQFGLDMLFYIGADLHILAPAGRAQFAHAGDLLAETHAARAVDAAGQVGLDQGADIFILDHPLFFLIARDIAAIAEREVLQLAFAALIADRAIQRVIDQEEFHDGFLRVERRLRAGAHLHVRQHGRGAGGQGLGGLLHLDQAHAAVGRDREFLVVAKARDVDVMRVGDLDQHLPLPGRQGLTVHFNGDLCCRHDAALRRPRNRARPGRPGSVYGRCDIETRPGNASQSS